MIPPVQEKQRDPSAGTRRPVHPRIAMVCQPEYFRFMYETDLTDLGEVAEFRTTMEMGSGDYAALLDYDADFNFFCRGEFVPDEVLCQLRGTRIALSSEPFPRRVNGRWELTRDSVGRYLWFRMIRRKPFDYLYHYDAASLPLLERDGLSPSGAFPFPVATAVYAPRSLPRRWDVFFIGRSTPHREAYFWPLKHVYEFLHISHGIWGPPLVEYICSSVVSLNVHAEGEVSWEPRLQMLLSCEAFVISEPITPNEFLRPGVDYVAVTSPSEMRDAVDHYLQHADERRAIAKSGRARVLEVLDSRASFARLLAAVEEGTVRPFAPGSPWRVMSGLGRTRSVLARLHRGLS